MPDFTLHTFRRLLLTLKEQHYTFQTFAAFLKDPAPRAIILRHDIDASKLNSLKTARLEAELGITGTYNFRMLPQSFDEGIIRQISTMGHEIGYHYEDLSTAKGDHGKAMQLFEQNLAKLRHIVPVETICMHGSPLSKHNNRKLWEKYDYRDYGIAGEPYFDVDFTRVLYLTDTGRRWDGEAVSIRDKIPLQKQNAASSDTQSISYPSHIHSTFDLIRNAPKLPEHIMITIHPQRWDDRPLKWIREYIFQNVKNIAKRMMLIWR
jgi:hypothetical protein